MPPQQTVNRMAMLESRGKRCRPVPCRRHRGSGLLTISTPWIRPSQHAERFGTGIGDRQAGMEQKRAELLETMRYRKSSILLILSRPWRYDTVVSARISNYSMNVPGDEAHCIKENGHDGDGEPL